MSNTKKRNIFFVLFASFYLYELAAKMASELTACMFMQASGNNFNFMVFAIFNEDIKVNRNAHIDNILVFDYFSS